MALKLCSRTACQAPEAICRHTDSDHRMYCVPCARKINRACGIEGLVEIPKPRTVFVVCNEGDNGGGGFRWFETEAEANKDFETTVNTMPDDCTAFQGEMIVPDAHWLTTEDITEYMESRLDEIQARPQRKSRNTATVLRTLCVK